MLWSFALLTHVTQQVPGRPGGLALMPVLTQCAGLGAARQPRQGGMQPKARCVRNASSFSCNQIRSTEHPASCGVGVCAVCCHYGLLPLPGSGSGALHSAKHGVWGGCSLVHSGSADSSPGAVNPVALAYVAPCPGLSSPGAPPRSGQGSHHPQAPLLSLVFWDPSPFLSPSLPPRPWA